MHFCSHEFFFFVALFFAVFEAFFCVEQSRFHLPGFFELCPCLKSSALPVSFLFDRMFLPIHRSGCCICISVNFFDWLWLLFGGCLRYEIEVWVIYVYFVVWLAKNYYLGFEWWILWIFVFHGGNSVWDVGRELALRNWREFWERKRVLLCVIKTTCFVEAEPNTRVPDKI